VAIHGFKPEFLDFDRGIHVGNLEESQRITRILKLAIEARFQQSFVTERWGRGVYWRWIGFLSRANREAMPISSGVSFGCSKYFVSLEPEEGVFKCGLQVERGYLKAPRGSGAWQLQPDWDWNWLLAQLKPSAPLDQELRRLLGEGFHLFAGSLEAGAAPLDKTAYPGAAKLKRLLLAAPAAQWAGFQVYFPMTAKEVRLSTGADLIGSILAVFEEVTPILNLCQAVRLS
jgi:hypothetical protein